MIYADKTTNEKLWKQRQTQSRSLKILTGWITSSCGSKYPCTLSFLQHFYKQKLVLGRDFWSSHANVLALHTECRCGTKLLHKYKLVQTFLKCHFALADFNNTWPSAWAESYLYSQISHCTFSCHWSKVKMNLLCMFSDSQKWQMLVRNAGDMTAIRWSSINEPSTSPEKTSTNLQIHSVQATWQIFWRLQVIVTVFMWSDSNE